MNYYTRSPHLLFVISFVTFSLSINAQYVSPNDKNGNRKSSYDVKTEEARNKEIKSYKPSSTPVSTPARTNEAPTRAAKSELPDYGKYDFISSPDPYNTRIVRLNGKWGLISEQGEMVMPLIYEFIDYLGGGSYTIVSDKKIGFANTKGEITIPIQFQRILQGFDRNGQAKVKKGGYEYFIDYKGEPVPEANQTYRRFSGMGKRGENPSLVSLRNVMGETKFGFLDSSDKIKIPLIYDQGNFFNLGVALVKSGTKWGGINKNGETVIPFIYDNEPGYLDNFYLIKENYKVGVIDRMGKIVIPTIYEENGLAFTEGCIPMKLFTGWGFVDSISGKEIIPFKYASAKNFYEGLAVVSKMATAITHTYGFVNKSGVEVIPLEYEEARQFSTGLAGVKLKGKWGFIDQQHTTKVKFIYEDVRFFNEGLAPVKLKGKWGFVNRSGKLVIPCNYDNTYSSFNEGEISVLIGGKWGSINTKGDQTIAPLYSYPIRFINGEAFTSLNGENLFINKAGIIIARHQQINGEGVRVPLEKVAKPAL